MGEHAEANLFPVSLEDMHLLTHAEEAYIIIGILPPELGIRFRVVVETRNRLEIQALDPTPVLLASKSEIDIGRDRFGAHCFPLGLGYHDNRLPNSQDLRLAGTVGSRASSSFGPGVSA